MIFSRRRTFLFELVLLGLALQVAHASAAETDAQASHPTTLLFFDDEPLYQRDNVERFLGKPQRVGQYHETVGNCTWGYPGVFRMADTGKWRMVYNSGVGKSNTGAGLVLIVESDDGLSWKPCDTTDKTKIPANLRRCKHQVLPNGAGSLNMMSSVFEDPQAPAAERYKLLTTVPARLWTSADLIDWKLQDNVVWQAEAPDPPSFVFWNDVQNAYCITTRPGHSDRRITLLETKDWKQFTRPVLALHADADDRPLAQMYGMYVLPYEGYYVGALWMYHSGPASPRHAPHRYLGGKQDTYLAYSLNGTHWMRCRHEPLFANGAGDAPDAGCLQVSSIVPLDDRTLRCYASSSTREHGHCPPEDGYLTIYDLRRDGFVGLRSQAGVGRVGTRALYWQGGEAQLNMDASQGQARVAVVNANGTPLAGYTLDDCLPFTGDEIGWAPQWKEGRTLSQLANRMIRLNVELRQATLYALRGRFTLTRLEGVQRFDKQGIPPDRRPGF